MDVAFSISFFGANFHHAFVQTLFLTNLAVCDPPDTTGCNPVVFGLQKSATAFCQTRLDRQRRCAENTATGSRFYANFSILTRICGSDHPQVAAFKLCFLRFWLISIRWFSDRSDSQAGNRCIYEHYNRALVSPFRLHPRPASHGVDARVEAEGAALFYRS